MIMRPLTNSEVREILLRQEAIERHQPQCPHCHSEQVQIKFKQKPARWQCRRCKQFFTSEPSDDKP
jgi:transposase-like protein